MQMQVLSPDLERLLRDARRSKLMTISSDVGGAAEVSFLSEMSKNIRADLKPVVTEIRTKVKAIPSGSSRQLSAKGRRTQRAGRSAKAVEERPRGLRDSIARGVQMKVNLSGRQIGVRLRVDPRHFPRGSKTLPKYLEGMRGYEHWRSPSWGRRGAKDWKEQPAHPYFFDTIRPHVPRVQAAVLREFEKLARELAGGGQ